MAGVFPGFGIEMGRLIEGGYEFIAVAARAFGKVLGSGKMQRYALQDGFDGHENSFEVPKLEGRRHPLP
jgi:hypothetical protein